MHVLNKYYGYKYVFSQVQTPFKIFALPSMSKECDIYQSFEFEDKGKLTFCLKYSVYCNRNY